MAESLKRKLHDDIVRRWVDVRTPGHKLYGRPDYDDSHIMSIKVSRDGSELWSYGSHFPLVRAVRDNTRKSRPVRLWLLNGDRWGGSGGFGVATSSQQAMVRDLTRATGIQTVILPYSALEGASIIHDSIRVLAEQEETWERVIHVQREFPDGAKWEPRHEAVEGTGYANRYESMDDIPADIRAYFTPEGEPLPQYEYHRRQREAFGRTYTDWNHAPMRDYASGRITREGAYGGRPGYMYVPPVYRLTGKVLRDRQGEWTQREDGAWTQARSVHTLGAAVFRAAYRGSNGKTYWANFLSAVDNSPHGSGYFLVQLPRKADCTSVETALDSLKPETVRAAESIGLEVKRQGDLYAIPTEFTLRDLRRMGADVRQSAKAGEGRRAAIRQRWEDRYATALMELGIPAESWARVTPVQAANRQRMASHYRELVQRELRAHDATARIHTQRRLYGTRHEGTEVATLPNGVVLARGTMRHTGGQHRMLPLGKQWHIIARNTVPLAR